MRVLILFSDTGGGHRAASQAIQAALEEIEPGIEVVMLDGLVLGGPWPLNRAPAIYSFAMKWCRWAWAFVFHLWNGPLRSKVMADLGYPSTARRLRRLIASANADVVVSTHPLLTRSVVRCLRKLERQVPFGIVVTDLVTGHWSWYEPGADRIFVPTPEAFEIVRKGGVDLAKLQMTGQAVHPRCGRATGYRSEIRLERGWTERVALIVGGGEGMGALGEHARVIDDAQIPGLRVVVVCGRNARLRSELESHPWHGPVEIHGFVEDLHRMMAGADILISKSGPGSIMEGCVAGLPILLYDYLPGQEVGNVRLVEGRGFGHYAPRPADLVRRLRFWLEHPEERERAAAASRAYAIPDSAHRIGRGILEMAQV